MENQRKTVGCRRGEGFRGRMNSNIRLNLEKKVNLLRDALAAKVKETDLSDNVRRYLLSYIDLLGAKYYLSSNFDDLLWFCENGLFGSERVLDFGAGGGYITYLISDLAKNIVAYDYAGEWVDKQYTSSVYFSAFSLIHEVINSIGVPIPFRFYQKLPLGEKDASFDGIVLYAVIEHIGADIKGAVLAELHRILRPGGLLYIAKLPRLYSYQEFLSRKLNLESHSDLYTRDKIRALLGRYSFEIIKIGRTGLFTNYEIEMTRKLFPLFNFLEGILKFTPVSFFSHDYRLVARKV